MKLYIKILSAIAFSAVAASACSGFLDIEPKDKISSKVLFSDPEGIKLYMANLYSHLPIEDFYYFRNGFNHSGSYGPNHDYGEMMTSSMFTDEATHSQYQAQLSPNNFLWWEEAFTLIRDINILSDAIPELPVSQSEKDALEGEVAFLKAYTYFGLVIRYGGVPIIDKTQEWTGDVDALKVPRATEKQTWDYILSQCDEAIGKLPETGPTVRRADRYVAAALTSRIALHAASIAKFHHTITIDGQAVDGRLVGLEEADAQSYYEQAIAAAEIVIGCGEFGLYMPEPATPEEAAENYRHIFEHPNDVGTEAIFTKGYTKKGIGLGHNYDIYFNPAQTAGGWPHPGRMNPNLELVDKYESYGSDGESAPVVTSTATDDLTDYSGFDASKEYLKFDAPADIFKDKDARLKATLILPGTEWKGETIRIQAGLVKKDGSLSLKSTAPYELDGIKYYPFGAATGNQYSGFDATGGNYTRTGFGFKKFLDSENQIDAGYDNGLNDWIDLRYAEVLLNYIEAVFESNNAEKSSTALEYLNDIRRRAGFTYELTGLTSENIQRERSVELAFENRRFWDLMRRREYHQLRNGNQMHALYPILDLRGEKPQYIYVRSMIDNLVDFTFYDHYYYHPIPGTGSNGLIQNPKY